MSNLVESIIAMDEGIVGGDAILLQPKRAGSNGAPDYLSASAIIRRIRTHGGNQWAFHTLQYRGGDYPVSGSGIYGDIDTVVQAAERQFGIKHDHSEWIQVNYTDPDFPPNLIA